MEQHTIPVEIMESYVRELRRGAQNAERFLGPTSAHALTQVAGDLESIIKNPTYRWVTTADAARILGKSEETIRRKCRSNTAPFRFEVRNGQYRIWLPDIRPSQAA